MKSFLKSSEPDLKKFIQSLETIHKNVLYMTYQVDKIRRDITSMQTDKGLQKQVNDYFTEDSVNENDNSPPEEVDHL